MGVRVLSGATFLAAVWLSGCAIMRGAPDQSVAMAPSSEVPSASGKVDVRSAPGGNTRLEVSVRFLAPPERVTPSATTYVVWVKSLQGDQAPQNMGALPINRNLEGSLSTITPLRSFEVFITPEKAATASKPEGRPVLDTRVVQP
jgi:hypothetical protein